MSSLKRNLTPELFVRVMLVLCTALITLGSVHFTTVSKVQKNTIYIEHIKEDISEFADSHKEIVSLMKSIIDQNNLIINSIIVQNSNNVKNYSSP